jgi:hemoglobin
MTTLPQGDLAKDPRILRTAAQHNHANVGLYAAVVQGGTVAVVMPFAWSSTEHRRAVSKRKTVQRKQPVLNQPDIRRPIMPDQEKPSLYDRLGGVYNIATVVEDFIDRLMVDPRLNANPRVDEAHHRVSPAGFKFLATEMVCWATGGPQTYSGRSMGDSHRHLMITDQEWQAMLDDFQQSLDRFGVPRPEQGELKAIVESTKEAIVVRPFQEGPAEPVGTRGGEEARRSG